MGRVVIAQAAATSYVPFSDVAGASVQGPVRSKAVIQGTDRPLLLWQHELEAGAELSFDKPDVGHVLYVLSGAIEMDGAGLEEEGAAIIEHRATARVRAVKDATLFHFHEREPRNVSRAGGHVHGSGKFGVLRARHAYASHLGTLWADSACPTCELWFHKSEFDQPRPQRHPHYHTTDEIIVVVKGEMRVGRRQLLPGTALAIDTHTPYGFGVPEAGLTFINFRASEPFNVQMPPEGKQPPKNEREHFRAHAISV